MTFYDLCAGTYVQHVNEGTPLVLVLHASVDFGLFLMDTKGTIIHWSSNSRILLEDPRVWWNIS